MRRRIKRDPDVITCKLCGKQFRIISASHLWYRHCYESDHPIQEYKERFRLRYAHCPETLALMDDARDERIIRAGLRWTHARFRAALRRLYKRVRAGEPYKFEDVLSRAGRRLYGSWPKAVRAAGIDYEEMTGRIVWTRARVLREICAVGRLRLKGAAQVPAKLKEVAERQFGSWQKAVEAAGLDYARFTEGRTLMRPRALMTGIRKLARERKAHAHSARRAPPMYYEAARRHFGSWEAAVRAAKVDYQAFTGKSRWSRERVVTEIRKLAERRRREPTGNPPVLYQAAVCHFGSWDQAVRAAGFDRLSLIRLRWERQSSARP